MFEEVKFLTIFFFQIFFRFRCDFLIFCLFRVQGELVKNFLYSKKFNRRKYIYIGVGDFFVENGGNFLREVRKNLAFLILCKKYFYMARAYIYMNLHS